MSSFIEVDYSQFYKHGQQIGGDVFLQSRDEDEKQITCTLSDGLGSGVKANVLASLTAHMAQKYAINSNDVVKSAEIIMNTLPVCKERKISYSTFSILKIKRKKNGNLKGTLAEYDNPGFLHIRQNTVLKGEKNNYILQRPGAFKEEVLHYSEFELQTGDRLVLFTDGITQAGLGTAQCPLGWREENVRTFILERLKQNPQMSAYELASAVTTHAKSLDLYKAKDDITCCTVYVRSPRKLLVCTGPPIDPGKDQELTDRIINFPGKKVLSGGTTSQIVSRIIGKGIEVNLKDLNSKIPPSAFMKGVDLVTEGMLTLNETALLLEKRISLQELPENAAGRLLKLLLTSDQVHFLVGTKINDAHQDPNIPFEIGIRRSIIRRIIKALKDNYLKETTHDFI